MLIQSVSCGCLKKKVFLSHIVDTDVVLDFGRASDKWKITVSWLYSKEDAVITVKTHKTIQKNYLMYMIIFTV